MEDQPKLSLVFTLGMCSRDMDLSPMLAGEKRPQGARIQLMKGRFSMRLMAALIAVAFSSAAAAQEFKTAVFDIELVDMSQAAELGIRNDQTQRLQLVSNELRTLLESSPQIQLIELTPKREEINRKAPLHKCNGCAEDLAKELGADLAVAGIVQKTSDLILSFAVTIRDVHSGKVVRGGQVDIRGNTDESWLRGIRWLVKNRLLSEPMSVQP
jgi:hypothetical protein